MPARDRRLGFRVPLEMFLNQYWKEKQIRALAADVSDTGVRLQVVKAPWLRVPDGSVVGLEFELPGTGEVVWARGEVCNETDDPYMHTIGIRFTAMARAHARLIRDYCVESRRERLGSLLARIREPMAAAA
jgi:hypothetical protein